MKVLELKGMPAFYATQAYHKLMLGLKMLPAYYAETYEHFFTRMDALPEKDQEVYVREAALLVKLDREEVLDLVQFVADSNGVPYGPENIKSLAPEQLHEIIVAVSMEIARSHRVRLLSEDEKKN
jgi:hypothetical protein